MFITPLAAMILTVVLLIVACLTIYVATKFVGCTEKRLGFFRAVVAVIYFTVIIMLLINLGFNPDIKFSLHNMFFALLLIQVVIVPMNAGFWYYEKPVNNIMLLMVTETVPCIILQYIALLCS